MNKYCLCLNQNRVYDLKELDDSVSVTKDTLRG